MTKLRDLLWEIVPESRERILSLENELIEEGTPHLQVGTLTYLSDGFFWEVFAPALTSRRVDVLVRCFSLVERLLQSDSFSLIEGVRLRIVDGIAWEAEWHAVVQLYAGSLLRKELVSASGDNSWCEAPPDEPLLEADFAEGAYGPTAPSHPQAGGGR